MCQPLHRYICRVLLFGSKWTFCVDPKYSYVTQRPAVSTREPLVSARGLHHVKYLIYRPAETSYIGERVLNNYISEDLYTSGNIVLVRGLLISIRGASVSPIKGLHALGKVLPLSNMGLLYQPEGLLYQPEGLLYQPEGFLYTSDGIMCQPGRSYTGQGLVSQPGHLVSTKEPPVLTRGPPMSDVGLPCRSEASFVG